MSGVITIGVVGIALLISLPFGVSITVVSTVTPTGSVSTIVIGPEFISPP